MRTSNYTRIGHLMALFTERYISMCSINPSLTMLAICHGFQFNL